MLDSPMSFSPAEIVEIVTNELARHPEASLVDIYKLLNQAHYGPTHIVPEASMIKKNILAEINGVASLMAMPLQDIGCKKGFYRVNLMSVFADKMLEHTANRLNSEYPSTSKGNILDDFVQSILDSRVATNADNPSWESIWDRCSEHVYDLVKPKNNEIDSINDLLINDSLPSHSNAYKKSYEPHYRVVHIESIMRNTHLKDFVTG